MQLYKNISRQLGYSYISYFVNALFGPLLVLVLTRSLSVAEYGVYSILSVTIMILSVVLDLGISQYFIAQFSSASVERLKTSFLSLLAFEGIFLALILTVLYGLVRVFLLPVFLLEEWSTEFGIAFMIVFFATLLRLSSGAMIARKWLERQSLVGLLQQSGWIILLLIFTMVSSELSLVWVVLIFLVGMCLTFVISCFFIGDLFSHFSLRLLTLKEIKHGIFFGLPMIPFLIGTWLVNMSDRYILQYYVGPEQVGLYSLAYTLCSIVLSLGFVVSGVFFPYLSEHFGKNEFHTLFNSSLKYALLIVIPSIAGVYFLSIPLVTLLSGVKYIASTQVLGVLLFFPFFNIFINLFYQTLIIQKKTVTLSVIYTFGAALNIILNIVLIPSFGIVGSAVATSVSYAFLGLCLYYCVRMFVHFDFRFLCLGRIFLASLFMGIAVWLIDPAHVLSKILTIIFGAAFYGILTYFLGCFGEAELSMAKKFLTSFPVIGRRV